MFTSTSTAPRGGDELNLIEPGRNYGWPAITYGRDYNFASIAPYTEYPGIEQPLAHWTSSIAPAGMAVFWGDLFPEWRGDLFVAALVERAVRRLEMEDGRVIGQEILFGELGERIRDVRVGFEGRFTCSRTVPTDACCALRRNGSGDKVSTNLRRVSQAVIAKPSNVEVPRGR